MSINDRLPTLTVVVFKKISIILARSLANVELIAISPRMYFDVLSRGHMIRYKMLLDYLTDSDATIDG